MTRLLISLSILFSPLALASVGTIHPPVCKRSAFDQIAEYVSKAPPFLDSLACANRPFDPKRVISRDELLKAYKDLAATIRTDLKAHQEFNARISACLKATESGRSCSSEDQKYLDHTKDVAKTARDLLAYIHAINQTAGDPTLNRYGPAAQEKLAAEVLTPDQTAVRARISRFEGTSRKITPWNSLSTAETKEAVRNYQDLKDSLSEEFAEALKRAPRKTAGERCAIQPTEELSEQRASLTVDLSCAPEKSDLEQIQLLREKFERAHIDYERRRSEAMYLETMANFNVLQFVNKIPVTDKDLYQATLEFDRRQQEESQRLAEVEQKLNRGELPSDAALYILGYDREVEATAAAHPEHCQIFSGLLAMQRKTVANERLALLPLLAASGYIPGLGQVAATTGLAGYAMVKSEVAYKKLLKGRMVSWDGEKSFVSADKIERRNRDFVDEVLQVPLTISGTRAATRAFKTGWPLVRARMLGLKTQQLVDQAP